MPVRKVATPKGKTGPCYRWGSQKTYCGKNAKSKAVKQGRAIRASGYKG